MTLGKKKYEEIMDKVVVTDEMRRRILQNIRRADAAPEAKVIRFPHWTRYAAAAACFAVLLISALVIPNMLHSTQGNTTANTSDTNTPVTGTQGIVECQSAEELSQKIGFPVSDLTALPFEVKETSYLSSFGEIAEIDYTGADGQTADYRKSTGTDDNSGDYDTFPDTKQITVGSVSVLLKGDGTNYTVAVWTDGTYAYSIVLSDGVGVDEWSAMIQEIH